jgi:hypothetical protein
MAGAMTREKRHALAPEGADHIRCRRLAERCVDAPLFPVRQLRHVIQTAAADDADADAHI